MRNRKSLPPRANRIGPNRPSGRLLLTGLPILTAGAAAYAAVAADYMLNVPSLPTLPLGAMGDSLIGSAVILLLGALLLHSEIDQADRLFDRVLAAQQNGLTDEFSLDRAELLAQLRHLPEVQRPTLKNLF